MKKAKDMAGPSLFDLPEQEPIFTQSPRPTSDPRIVESYIHSRKPGECIKKLAYFTGRTACEVGPVEIERAPHMIHVYDGAGHICYTYSRDHATDMDKFEQHFRETIATLTIEPVTIEPVTMKK